MQAMVDWYKDILILIMFFPLTHLDFVVIHLGLFVVYVIKPMF
jgi:hypothetical protein